MFDFSDHSLSTAQTDALLIEIDCLGQYSLEPYVELGQTFPEAMAALKECFETGQLEPGTLVRVVRQPAQTPRLLYLMPTRIHPQGLMRDQYFSQSLRQILNEALQHSVRSFGFCRIPLLGESDWPQFKLHILSTSCHVPAIRLQPLRFAPPDKPVKQVVIFSDGGVRTVGSEVRGGYGVVLRWGDNVKELSEAFRQTTCDRMELMGAIAGLEALKEPCRVRLHTDSRAVIDPLQSGLLFRQAAQNWGGKKVRNRDLWSRFIDAYLKHDVELVWVKGHAGIQDNERCDQLASVAIHSDSPKLDELGHGRVKGANTNPGQGGSKPKQAGEPCRHCGTALIRRESRKHDPNAAYWYQWYLFCQGCKRIYHVREARVERQN